MPTYKDFRVPSGPGVPSVPGCLVFRVPIFRVPSSPGVPSVPGCLVFRVPSGPGCLVGQGA